MQKPAEDSESEESEDEDEAAAKARRDKMNAEMKRVLTQVRVSTFDECIQRPLQAWCP